LVHDETRAGYERLRRHLEIFGVPVLAIPGNHDFPTLMEELYSEGLMRFCERGRVRTWRIYLLNTFQAGAVGGRVDPSALAAIHRNIQAEPETHALVCLHHHPVLIHSAWLDALGIENADLFNEFVRSQPQIRAVIWGHIHQEWDEWRGQTRYLGTPSTCMQFAPRLERMALDTREPGVRWLTLYDDGRLETEVVRVLKD
jgi:Icc protein